MTISLCMLDANCACWPSIVALYLLFIGQMVVFLLFLYTLQKKKKP